MPGNYASYYAPPPAVTGGGSFYDPRYSQEREDLLAQQRERAFASLDQGASLFRSDLGAAARNSIEGTLGGNRLPFTEGVQANLFSRRADAAAAERGVRQREIQRFFANSGMGGGGGELAALAGASRNYSTRTQQARNEIDVTSMLENFAAQERARDQAIQFMASQSAAEAPFRLKEADLRSRFEITGQTPVGTGRSGWGPAPVMAPQAQPGAARAGGGGGYSAEQQQRWANFAKMRGVAGATTQGPMRRDM